MLKNNGQNLSPANDSQNAEGYPIFGRSGMRPRISNSRFNAIGRSTGFTAEQKIVISGTNKVGVADTFYRQASKLDIIQPRDRNALFVEKSHGLRGKSPKEADSPPPYVKGLASAPQPKFAWTNVRSTLDQWEKLEEGWDGEDAAPFREEVLKAVNNFIHEAERYKVREPRPYLSSDGELGFHWDAERRAAITFLAEGRFLAFVEQLTGNPVRLSGPLDIATASRAMFTALAELT